MKHKIVGSQALTMFGALSLLYGISTTALAAGPQVVSGPGVDANCFKPWSDTTKYFKWPKKDGPYRIALVMSSDRSATLTPGAEAIDWT